MADFHCRSRKHGFVNRNAARDAAIGIGRRGGPSHYYLCPDCGFYHLTRRVPYEHLHRAIRNGDAKAVCILSERRTVFVLDDPLPVYFIYNSRSGWIDILDSMSLLTEGER